MKPIQATGWLKPLAIAVVVLFGAGMLQARAGGYHGHGGHHGHGYHHHGWGWPGISFSFGGPLYWGAPAYAAPYYAPAYAPAYGGDYVYRRPNYAIGGTLLGALAGGLIGDSIHHQGWEGAGIGAAAGLVLGTLAEHRARVQEQRAYNNAATANSQQNLQQNYVADAPTAPAAPVAAPAPTVPAQTSPSPSSGAMSRANSLFGR